MRRHQGSGHFANHPIRGSVAGGRREEGGDFGFASAAEAAFQPGGKACQLGRAELPDDVKAGHRPRVAAAAALDLQR